MIPILIAFITTAPGEDHAGSRFGRGGGAFRLAKEHRVVLPTLQSTNCPEHTSSPVAKIWHSANRDIPPAGLRASGPPHKKPLGPGRFAN